MSDNSELPGYAVFYPLGISLFSQSESRTHPFHVRILVLQYGRLIASYVLLNKRWLTGNRPGSTRRETGRKKSLLQHP